MKNFTLKSSYFHFVLLFLCFKLFKTSVSAMHLNSLKMLSQKQRVFMRVFPISSLIMPVNLIQYRGTVGMFNNRRFSSSSLNYSYFSKKYHNNDTFTLAIGLIILALWHLIYVLSNWKFRPRFLPDLVGIFNNSRKIPHLSVIGV